MKITLCGSIAFIDEMVAAKAHLEKLGHEVKIPLTEVPDENGKIISAKEYYALRKSITDNNSWIWKQKEAAMHEHFDKVVWADAILVLNYSKNGINNYIGANTLLEMGLALHYRKKIFLLNPIPEISYKEEILGTQPVVIGSLEGLSQ